MFIKSQFTHFVRPLLAHALADAVFKGTNPLNKLNDVQQKVADSYVRVHPQKVNDWTASIHSFKQRKVVSALMA